MGMFRLLVPAPAGKIETTDKFGADGETRTPTPFRKLAPKASASANSATSAEESNQEKIAG